MTYLTPPSPGPPGLKNSVPIRCAGSSAGRRATATLIFRPFGCDQSAGTRRVPHWATADPGHGAKSMLYRGAASDGSAATRAVEESNPKPR